MFERINADGCVLGANRAKSQGECTGGCVVAAVAVMKKRVNTVSRVVGARYAVNGSVVIERLITGGGVLQAVRVAIERFNPVGGVEMTRGVVVKRGKTYRQCCCRLRCCEKALLSRWPYFRLLYWQRVPRRRWPCCSCR